MIYIWKDITLARELKSGRVTEKEKFLYLLIYIFLPAVMYQLSCLMPAHPHVEHAEMTHSLGEYAQLLTLFGFALHLGLLCFFYRINAKGDNRHFIERYLCLILPFGVRLTLNIALISLVVGLLSAFGVIMKMNMAVIISPLLITGIVLGYITYYAYTRGKLLFTIASGQMD